MSLCINEVFGLTFFQRICTHVCEHTLKSNWLSLAHTFPRLMNINFNAELRTMCKR